MRVVEVLFFEGCPGAAPAFAAVDDVVKEHGLDVQIRRIEVLSNDAAEQSRFLGSPSIRVDGRDVEPGAGEREGFALQCRVYAVDGRLQKVPPRAWIEAALGLSGVS